LTPLTPFKIDRRYDGAAVNQKSQRQFWTSLDCEDIGRLGYTYDQLIPTSKAAENKETGQIILANINFANIYINDNFAWFQPTNKDGGVVDASFSEIAAQAIPKLYNLEIFTEKPPNIDVPIATLVGTPAPAQATLRQLYATGATGFADLWGTPVAEEQKSPEEDKSLGGKNVSVMEKPATATNLDSSITLQEPTETLKVDNGQHLPGSHLRGQSEDLKAPPSSHVDPSGIGLNGTASPYIKSDGTTANDPDE
jgi:hypothetical protein